MQRNRSALFKGRHFEAEIIVLCVRWYLRFGLSFRNLEELMAERNLAVDHITIWRWVQRYAPELHRRCRPELRMTHRSWRVDETYLRVAGKWTYLYRAVDSTGATIGRGAGSQNDGGAEGDRASEASGPSEVDKSYWLDLWSFGTGTLGLSDFLLSARRDAAAAKR